MNFPLTLSFIIFGVLAFIWWVWVSYRFASKVEEKLVKDHGASTKSATAGFMMVYFATALGFPALILAIIGLGMALA